MIQPQQSYQVVADQMRLEVFLKGQTAVPATLACDGNIVVREASQAAANQQPTEIRGGQLSVDKLDTKTPQITLARRESGAGANVPNNAGRQPARAAFGTRRDARYGHGRDGRPRQSHVERRAG